MKTTLKEVVNDKSLIAFCGLYCGACRSYLSGKCPGCRENVKASWCKVRECCMENNLLSCADCKIIELDNCKKYNNFISKMMGFIFNSDRKACIEHIKAGSYDDYAAEMTANKMQTIRRKSHSS